MHHHGYTWLGSAHDLHKDGPRRPLHPEFRSSKVVPLELAHWLLKPASFIQGTWTDPRQAAEWFSAQARDAAASFISAHDREAVGRAASRVTSGEDVVGGWYLTGQRFLSVCLIACSPHRTRPEIPCPRKT